MSPIVGPELEFYLLERDGQAPRGWRRCGDAAGNIYVKRRGATYLLNGVARRCAGYRSSALSKIQRMRMSADGRELDFVLDEGRQDSVSPRKSKTLPLLLAKQRLTRGAKLGAFEAEGRGVDLAPTP